jgi:putative toxin-antitoxin system antitoxin component (TIGR02293 family)
MNVTQMSSILGGEKVLHIKLEDRQDLIALVDHGVTKVALLNLAKYLSLSIEELAGLLPISRRTIHRYSAKQHFNRSVSEQILHITEVVSKGMEVFEDKDRFLAWMRQPSAALGNKTPLSLLSSRFGAEMVLDELGRIEHGIVS